MAMEYARLYFDFYNCEKVQYLMDICGYQGVVCLQRLWIRAGQRNNDGVFIKSSRALEKIAGWKGDPGLLINTLIDADFPLLDKLGEKEYLLHNWEENNPHLSEKAQEKRTERARKAANARWQEKENIDANSMQQECSEDAQCMLNDAKGMLGDANLTKRNLTELKVSKKPLSSKSEKIDLLDSLIDRIMNYWKKEANQPKLSLKTEVYRKQIKGRIVELKQREIKEDDDIFNAFKYVIDNKKKQAEDYEYIRFSIHDWNLRTLTRPKNFIPYLDEPLHEQPIIEYGEDSL
jgi:hypothetical protein